VLHMRVIAPAERSAEVRELLLAEPGATHVVVLPGAAVQPPGDVVEADVARESTDALLAQQCRLGVDRAGGVTLETIDTTLSDAADTAAVLMVSQWNRSRGRGLRRLSAG
jgi:hypothetical protein